MNDIKNYFALCNLLNYYCNYWIWLAFLFILNIGALFYINKQLKKKKDSLVKTDRYSKKLFTKDLILLLILTVVFLIWKIIHLGSNSFDLMESLNIRIAQEFQINVFSLLDNMIVQSRQPLYLFILNIPIRLLNPEHYSFFLRFISVFFGICTAYLTFHFSLKVFNNKLISYLSFIFLNVHSLFAFYSRRAEPYALFCFLALLSYYYFWQTFISHEEKKIWKYCLVGILCFFTHYFALVVIFSQFLTMLIVKWRNYRLTHSLPFSFLHFIKALVIFNFFIILWSPVMYSAIFSGFIFQDAWGNSFYLNQESAALVIDRIIKLVWGLPLTGSFGYLLILLYLYIILKLRDGKPSFYIFVVSILFSALLFGIHSFLCFWYSTSRLYFNVRHFTWIIPFIVMLYSYGIFLLNRSRSLFRKIIGYTCFSIILIWNIHLTNEMTFGLVNPAYKEALRYIKKDFRENDFVGFPADLIDDPITINAKGIFDSERYFDSVPPVDLLQRKLSCKRLWIVIPWEDYFGVPHLNGETLNRYINFLKDTLSLKSVWRSNKIDVYLFNTGRK
ncbi:MAG: glycosyltransferase family 39 protein [Candidatus Omnitrophica bacterium]|nr:glycosyltransferase family 39 protein [Candidatus Omnitrophota bacterium]